MDMRFLELLSNARTPALTWFNSIITVIGESTIFIAVLCLIFWCIDKKFAYRLGIVYVISGLIVNSTKILCRVPRPWVRDKSFKAVESAKHTATGYSFPSGHTQNVTALFSSFAFVSKKKSVKFACFATIFLVMFSRMYLGVHTPSDVLVSFGITIIVSFIINYYAENYSVHPSFVKRTMIFLIILTFIAVGIIAYVGLAVPGVPFNKLTDTAKAAGAAAGFIIGYYIETKHIRFSERATTLPLQIVKYIIGLVLTLLLNSVLSYIVKSFFSGILPLYFISKMLVILFILCVYPIIIKKFFTKEYYL